MKKILNTGPGLIIGIPTLGRPVPLEWALAFKSLNPPINFNTTFHLIKGKEIGEARQEMALNAVKANAKYLFFIGDDVEIPNHAFRSMIYRMEQSPEIGVIGGVYCAKAEPAFPLVFRGDGQGSYWDWKVGEFFECTGLGMDCTLIRVDLLRELSQIGGDLFKTVRSDQFLDGINNAEEWTEDLFFLKRVRDETKYKIYCDGGVICNHWDVYGGKKYNLPPDSLPLRTLAVQSSTQRLLDIGNTLTDSNGFQKVSFGPEGSDYRGHPSMLPFEKEEFDAVNISANYFTSVESVDPILKDIVRVLKDGGIGNVVITEAFSREWLKDILMSHGCTITKEPKGLVEFKKGF